MSWLDLQMGCYRRLLSYLVIKITKLTMKIKSDLKINHLQILSPANKSTQNLFSVIKSKKNRLFVQTVLNSIILLRIYLA
jgi:hypothetical protein